MNKRTNKITVGHYRIGSTEIRLMSDIRNVDSLKVSVDELLSICIDDVGKDVILQKLGVDSVVANSSDKKESAKKHFSMSESSAQKKAAKKTK